MTSGLFFDWYACSLDHDPDLVMIELLGSYPHGTWETVKPKNGYSDAMSLILPDLSVAATLWWGGASQGAAVYAFATGSNANTFSSVVRSLWPVHRVVRVDIAVDFNESGAWVSLNSLAHNLYENKFVRNSPHYVGELGKEAVDSPDVRVGLYTLVLVNLCIWRGFYEKGKKTIHQCLIGCVSRSNLSLVVMHVMPMRLLLRLSASLLRLWVLNCCAYSSTPPRCVRVLLAL